MRAEEVAVAFGLAARPRSSRSLGLGLSSGGVQGFRISVCSACLGSRLPLCRGGAPRIPVTRRAYARAYAQGQDWEAGATERDLTRILENGSPPRPCGTRAKRHFENHGVFLSGLLHFLLAAPRTNLS